MSYVVPFVENEIQNTIHTDINKIYYFIPMTNYFVHIIVDKRVEYIMPIISYYYFQEAVTPAVNC